MEDAWEGRKCETSPGSGESVCFRRRMCQWVFFVGSASLKAREGGREGGGNGLFCSWTVGHVLFRRSPLMPS